MFFKDYYLKRVPKPRLRPIILMPAADGTWMDIFHMATSGYFAGLFHRTSYLLWKVEVRNVKCAFIVVTGTA